MKILLAGATGAVGTPLVSRLRRDGHAVVAITHSAEGSRALAQKGVEPIVADVLESASVIDAVKRVRPDVIINELTALPKRYTPEAMKEAFEHDRKVRLEGHANLLSGARAIGLRRYILQSAAFWYAPGSGLADETEQFAFDASPGIAAGTRTYAELESSLFGHSEIQAVALRYGFFYGGSTWFTKEGDMGEQVRQEQVPVIGEGEGISNFVHVEDAAAATAAALDCAPGVYNVVDDDPSPQSVWLPAFARWAGAPEPPHVTEQQALDAAGPDAVYYATQLRGASNQRAKRVLGFRPRPLEWL